MTDKQKQILKAAMKLFAEHGYDGVSTYALANEAGVSQGLIFRHFGSKNGLLEALMKWGGSRAKKVFDKIDEEKDPRKRLASIIELPFGLSRDQVKFWRIIFSLSWVTKRIDPLILSMLKSSLEKCFTEIGVEDPHLETTYFNLLFQGLFNQVLLNPDKDFSPVKDMIMKRYGDVITV